MIAPKRYAEQATDTEKLVKDNMQLVQRIAWHFSGRIGHFAEIDELLQAGYLGLVDASQRYSPREGVTFAAYAAIRIRGSIVDLLRRNSNLCRATIEMRGKVNRARTELEQKHSETKGGVDELKTAIKDHEGRIQALEIHDAKGLWVERIMWVVVAGVFTVIAKGLV